MIKDAVARAARLFAALAFSLILSPSGTAQARSGEEIDASVDAALQLFRKDVKGADEYLKGAKGVLVLTDVKKVGFVVGAQWGEGAIRVGGKSVEYYKMQVGSFGFQAGFQDASFLFLFLTQDALDTFRASGGWGAGLESSITIADASTPSLTLDTLRGKSSVVGFVFGKSGLMAGWSAKGMKFTKISG
jgi:lipid-binding SYLF domain-containing protein